MNYYNQHIGDYAKDTRALSQGEHGAYRLLMDEAYATENGIDPEDVYAIACAKTSKERHNTDRVITKFFFLREGRYYQKRIEEEIAAYRKKSAKASESAMHRWNERNANAMRTHKKGICEFDAPNNQEPIANSQQPITNPTLSDKQKAPGKNKRGANALAPVDPDWLPPEWKTYLQLRKEKRATLAPTWRVECLKQLDCWRLEGYDVAEILRRTISNGYTGLFPPKANGSSGSNREAAAAWLRSEEAAFIDGESERLPDA